jgi:CubicO group peptidase (beta-lactamase class C family)
MDTRDVVARIKAGEFQSITSVVAFTGDEVVCEAYFDGDATTPRNPRSATKTVLAILVGIAIDRGVLHGVDTAISRLLPSQPKLAPRPGHEVRRPSSEGPQPPEVDRLLVEAILPLLTQ